MSYCYLAFRTNVLLNLYCPGHLSYYSPNESEPLNKDVKLALSLVSQLRSKVFDMCRNFGTVHVDFV